MYVCIYRRCTSNTATFSLFQNFSQESSQLKDTTWVWTLTRYSFLTHKVTTHIGSRVISASSHLCQHSAPIFTSSWDRQGTCGVTGGLGAPWLRSEGSWLQLPCGRDRAEGKELQQNPLGTRINHLTHNRELWFFFPTQALAKCVTLLLSGQTN